MSSFNQTVFPIPLYPSTQKNPLILSGLAEVHRVARNEESLFDNSFDWEVGTILFKFLGETSSNTDYKNLPTARPIDVGSQEFPMKNDVVMIFRGVSHKTNQESYYYSKRVNINSTLQFNSFGNTLKESQYINVEEENNNSAAQGRENIRHKTSTVTPIDSSEKNYKKNVNIKNLKHFDGDMIFQNRYGATIRLGSSQMEDALNQKTVPTERGNILGPTNSQQNDPILIFRVGQREDPIITKNTPFALMVEDINLDSSCFVMSENQQINFHFSNRFPVLNQLKTRRNISSLYTSLLTNQSDGLDKIALTGKQAILNSNRIVLNSKETDLVFSSNQHAILAANQNIILDGGSDIYINPVAGKVYLGTVVDVNSAVKYNELAVILNLVKLALKQLASNPMAPSPGVNPLVERMNIGTIKSQVVKIEN